MLQQLRAAGFPLFLASFFFLVGLVHRKSFDAEYAGESGSIVERTATPTPPTQPQTAQTPTEEAGKQGVEGEDRAKKSEPPPKEPQDELLLLKTFAPYGPTEVKTCYWDKGQDKWQQKPDTTTDHAKGLIALLNHTEQTWWRRMGNLYHLIDGSLLGAWRNGGVIPDDEDVDIALFLRPGEDRFTWLERARKELPVGWFLEDVSNTPRLKKLGNQLRVEHRKFSPQRGHLRMGTGAVNVTMDILVYTPEKLEGKYTPICRCSFEPIGMVWGLTKAERYFVIAYGSSYKKPHDYHNKILHMV